MKKRDMTDWLSQSKIKNTLYSFSIPKTPRDVEKELNITRFNLKPLLKRNMIKCLDPESYKGRLYVLTKKARKLLQLPDSNIDLNKDWKLISNIKGSQKLKKIVLITISKKPVKRTSDELLKENDLNHMHRITIKNTLNSLIKKGLVETELTPDLRRIFRGRKIYTKKLRRYYWISEKGKEVLQDLKLLECTT
jgi:DNA-binding PadR family transcriptional regulator